MFERRIFSVRRAVLAGVLLAFSAPAATNQIVGWNNLGMHCMDSDYSVFSILPPYNTIEAQLIVGGTLVTNGTGYTVSYEAVADPDGSFNSTAMGKGNFYTYSAALFGATPAPEMGLAGWGMPGVSNAPQPMLFEATNAPAAGVATPVNWWRAEGIPLSPYDDAHRKNPYPLMRLIARNNLNQPLATNDIVLPISDEMDCRTCHASGTDSAAKPAAGWVWSDNPERDYRLNILRLHDEKQFADYAGLYADALAARGFNEQGLYRNVVADDKPVLCAACHSSEALGAPSYGSIPSLTASVHSLHASVRDPGLNVTLDDAGNRAACYRCHPGSTTRCLRGAMGGAIAADGSMEMQCQSCHGNMSTVGRTNRVGWFMEPNCQSCHAGTANHTATIRYTTVFSDTNGTVRAPVDSTFATQPDIPAPGLSLYRFSAGHGGLQCEACHGSTHAEFPSTHRNDNLRNINIQGHAGVMVECLSCHPSVRNTVAGGPHGMHPVGQSWVNGHGDLISGLSKTMCQACHGTDYRGTVLSRVQANRTLSAFGTKTFFRGAIVGCYTCHNGPNSESANNAAAPVVSDVFTNTSNAQAVSLQLPATGSGFTLRIISQASNGSVGLAGTVATYFPNPGFVGTDSFTFAAYDGSKNSNPGTGTVTVTQGPFRITARALVPASFPSGWPVPFTAMATPDNVQATPDFDWDFGDGAVHGTNQYATHTYADPGNYNWRVISRVQSGSLQSTVTNAGSILIEAPATLSAGISGNTISLSWPMNANALVEQSAGLGSDAHWIVCPNAITFSNGVFSVFIPQSEGAFYYRLRKL